MLSMIRNAINMYKKANNFNRATRSDYPEIIKNIFGVNIPKRKLEDMSAMELLDVLIREEF